MLNILIKAQEEAWDPETETFISLKKDITLQLEHSLISVSKWESRWKKPYLSSLEQYKKTPEEIKDYIKCMTVSSNIDPIVYNFLSKDNIEEINNYIEDPMTATWFNEGVRDKLRKKSNGKSEIITSELLYYYMIQYDIPWETQKWHFNRFLTLLNICMDKENSSGKKMSTRDLLSRNSSLNKLRRAATGSRG